MSDETIAAIQHCDDLVKPGIQVSSKYARMNPMQAAWESANDRALAIEKAFPEAFK